MPSFSCNEASLLEKQMRMPSEPGAFTMIGQGLEVQCRPPGELFRGERMSKNRNNMEVIRRCEIKNHFAPLANPGQIKILLLKLG